MGNAGRTGPAAGRGYRFLLTPGWLGRLALALGLAAVMVALGFWQLDRYQERSAINARIDAADPAHPVPLTDALPPPAPDTPVGGPPPAGALWTMATVTGRYDPAHEILVRGRTVGGRVGFVVVTPVVRADGTAVLVSRGWVPPSGDSVVDRPEVPPAPPGEVTVVGRVRGGESGGPAPELRDGVLQARRIDPGRLAPHLPYPLYGGYLQLARQEPAADPGLTPIPAIRERTWMNAGYTAQWWIFAGFVLVGFGWLARREARRPAEWRQSTGNANVPS